MVEIKFKWLQDIYNFFSSSWSVFNLFFQLKWKDKYEICYELTKV